MNPRLVRPVAAEMYIPTKATWVRRGRQAIEIEIQGAGQSMLPVWIPMAFLRASGNFSWAFVMEVCTSIVHGPGVLLHQATSEPINTHTEPELGGYVYVATGN